MDKIIDSKKSARVIVGFGGGDDAYQQNKFTCAHIMCQDKCDQWEYVTQWVSGTCLFVNLDRDQFASVNPRTEKITFSLVG